MSWRHITPLLNAEFANRPMQEADASLTQRGNRNNESVRQHFREMRHSVQARLDAQRNYFGEEDALENSALADVLLSAFESVETPPSSDEGEGGEQDEGGEQEVEQGGDGEGGADTTA